VKLLMRISVCAGLALGLLGCSGPEVNITEVLNHGQCRNLDEGFQQISMQALPGIRGARLLKLDPLSDPPTDATITSTANSNFLLFAISKGPQPTAGYQFELMTAEAEGLVVKLDYAWRAPEPGSMVAQVRTTPCSVVQLETSSKVEAVSAWLDGAAFGRVDLKQRPDY
jgi:hypothetical protein